MLTNVGKLLLNNVIIMIYFIKFNEVLIKKV